MEYRRERADDAHAAPRGGRMLAWQGWQMRLPAEWNPVRLEGGYEAGSMLVADLQGARLALRWQRPGRRQFDAARCVESAMEEELGRLAAAEARPMPLDGFDCSMLYVEQQPPGRDLWTAYSPVSRRLVQAVYRIRRREHLLAGVVLPCLRDTPPEEPSLWAVFDMCCVVPAGMKLLRHVLSAGDVSLCFAAGRQRLGVRQIAIADIALKRMPLEKWLADEQRRLGRHYRADGAVEAVECAADGRTLAGLAQTLVRRKRFFWMADLPRTVFCMALHDRQRNRLLLVHGSDAALVRQTVPTMTRTDCGRNAGGQYTAAGQSCGADGR